GWLNSSSGWAEEILPPPDAPPEATPAKPATPPAPAATETPTPNAPPPAADASEAGNPLFSAVSLPAASAGKKFGVSVNPYISFNLNFQQNLAGQDRNQTDVRLGNFDPDSGVVTETQPRGQLDTQFGVEQFLLGVQLLFDENWSGGAEVEASDMPQIGGANPTGGSAINLSLAYLQYDFGAGLFNHSIAFGRIPTLYVNYFNDVLWRHRFVAKGLLERNNLEFRTDDGVRIDGFNAARTLLWGFSLTNGAPVGNETAFDGGKAFSAMLVMQPFKQGSNDVLGGLKFVAFLDLLERASVANPRQLSAKRHLLLGMFYTAERFRAGFEVVPWGTRGREARKPTSTEDGNVLGLSLWAVIAPQPAWDVFLRIDLWDPNIAAQNHDGVFIASPTITKTAPGQEQFYMLAGASKQFNPFVAGSLNLEMTDDTGKLQFTAAGAQKPTTARVDLSVRFHVAM
ncbi:MAG TPA: hypothetical protein VL860_05050, partial [Planctomycetota bacterium]|nr:hypothetical protein [Planctomycetota bacterium]